MCGRRAEEELAFKGVSTACVRDEPYPEDPDSPPGDVVKLRASLQPIETIDLLRLPEPPDRAKLGEGLNNSITEGTVPAAAICSADEAECFRLMPYCKDPERLSTMPYPEETSDRDESSAEEQEDARARPVVDARAAEERLQEILRSYLQEGCCPPRTKVDTLEFRPSDAKKGEFDRIPF
jgi:hypothetical protein